MRVFNMWKQSLVGLGLVLGLLQATAASTTYSGSYSARASVNDPFTENGTITLKVEDDGKASCTVLSKTGMGTFTGTGTFKQATTVLGKPLPGRFTSACSYQNFPQFLLLSGNNEKDAGILWGSIQLKETTRTVTMVGTFSINLTPVEGE